MEKNDLFKELDVSNKVSRNGFNLSSITRFTAKCGELLPVYHKSVIPGDKFRMSVNSFTRTRPVQTAAFTKFKEYYDWFFVPYRVLGKQIPQILAKNIKNPSIASSATTNQPVAMQVPYIDMSTLLSFSIPEGKSILRNLFGKGNEFGFDRGYLSAKLLNHLGYNYLNLEVLDNYANDAFVKPYRLNLDVSLLPIAAYQKIYYDFYRNSQWENNVPYNYNFDYMGLNMRLNIPPIVNGSQNPYYNNPTMFDLRYADYPKDLFMGLLPDSQYGDESVMDVDFDINDTSTLYSPLKFNNTNLSVVVGNELEDATQFSITGVGNSPLVSSKSLSTSISDISSKLSAGISVLEERKARALQKYKEILGSGSLDYQTIIRKIFNVDIPDTLADHCLYLGGSSFVININEVENTNLTADRSSFQRGKGIGSGNGDMVEFDSDEFGIVMCIYHCAPIVDYALTAMHFDVVKTNADDYANPVFDNLGFVEFPTYFLSNGNINFAEANIPYNFLGYTTRYFDYKTHIDMTLGDFRETLQDWIAPINDEYLIKRDPQYGFALELDYKFFKINPRLVDKIFAVNADNKVTTDHFMVNATFNVNAVRNLNYLGVPF